MSASEISEQSSTQACESVSSFDFTGTGMDLFILYMKNFILTLITCGLYFPWAKTNIRKFTLSHIKLQDDYFEFTGTGKEVFFGLLKIFGFILLFVVVMMLFHLGMFLIFDQFLSQENSVKFGVPFCDNLSVHCYVLLHPIFDLRGRPVLFIQNKIQEYFIYSGTN